MKRHTIPVGALAATFITGCASLDGNKTPELFETGTQTGTHIDRPGLPPKTTDPFAVQQAFRNPGSAVTPDPGQR